ncbi:MAG TPA: cytochrome c oxidase assembly protein [Oceanicaulis sp.]|jgi:cytochrome c oxidase assembly protein subunit 11|uniref:Cytochrome c oxidase assembly protein CtaG n=1 Tax=Glycocaulis albus TaxID=1382801 RepID=A0ABQ1XM08_9PROT|nr:cytochrome c oxidase assembly protein [Glycocaulis albus]MBV5259873.1 cytochrome c oxidase assembly protein [Synechococcus moorigangaii CMS01]GGG97457.1 cytochrome c oxidase assembly protein CtaG [Glycocaulis albus]HCY56600.1 cytochrome c oxidase assembly protein [Oceanicaulis sp.]
MKLPVLSGNVKVLAICLGLALGMVGMGYAAVPLYDLFCRVTGYGGTTQTAQYDPDQILERTVRVRFDASRSRGFPWEFEPLQRDMTVRVGETALAFYRVTNPTDEPVTGIATYNVTPFKMGPYFAKLECFCFTEQTLGPGESMEMPVVFFIDPLMDEERRMDDVQTVTLSYTFFEASDSRARNLAERAPANTGR